MSAIVPSDGRLNSQLQAVAASFRQLYPQISQGKFNMWEMAQIAVVCSLVPGFWYLKKRIESKSTSWSRSETSCDGMANGSTVAIRKNVDINRKSPISCICKRLLTINGAEDEVIDPGLLKKHSTVRSYKTTRFEYPSLRIFFQRRMSI
jgi:hypothetical protein